LMCKIFKIAHNIEYLIMTNGDASIIAYGGKREGNP
jgi:hypothetical protein